MQVPPYVGHLFTKEGLKRDEAKVKAIKEILPPDSPEALHRFLGMINYKNSLTWAILVSIRIKRKQRLQHLLERHNFCKLKRLVCFVCYSFTPRKYKINLVRTLAYCCIRICSSPRLLQFTLDDLKRILLLNGYPVETVKYRMNDVI